MERRLKPVQALAMGILVATLVVCAPWPGRWPAALCLLVGAGFLAADASLERLRRPELASAAAWVFCQVTIAAAVALEGDRTAPPLPGWPSRW